MLSFIIVIYLVKIKEKCRSWVKNYVQSYGIKRVGSSQLLLIKSTELNDHHQV